MKAKMKKNAKAFLAILFSAVLVFEAWGGQSVISDTATSTQTIANTTTEDGTAANSDVSVSSNYYVEPLTDANYLSVASASDAIVLAASTEDGKIGTAMPETISTTSTETDYYIETLDQFNDFQASSKSNSFAGITIHLAANIELDGDFAGIGSADYPFSGTFNGHGYSITKLSSTTNGLFVAVNGATIQNLAICSAKIALSAAASNVGILAGTANGATVEGVTIASSKVTADTTEATSAIGGMFGLVSGSTTIKNSDVKRLTIKTSGMTDSLGGFVGKATAATTMEASSVANSYIKSTYTSTTEYVSYVGGVVGHATASVTADDVDAAAMNISVASLAQGVGSIAGYVTGNASAFEGCNVTVTKIAITSMNDLEGNESYQIGGFAGCVDSDSTFADCHVANGTIKPQGRTNCLGGFIGGTYSEKILATPATGAVTVDRCTVKSVKAQTASSRACGKVGGLIGFAGEGIAVSNCLVDNFVGPQNTNSSDVGGLIGNVYATTGAATSVTSCLVTNTTVSGKNYLGEVLGRSTAANATIAYLRYYNCTVNRGTDGLVYENTAIGSASATGMTSGELAWKLNTVGGGEANSLVWTQGATSPEYDTEDTEATVRVAFVQPSGTVYRYTDATGNIVIPDVDTDYSWPTTETYYVQDTTISAAYVADIGVEFPVPMSSEPTEADYSIKTKEQLESFAAASKEYDFTGITIHVLDYIDWGGEAGGSFEGIGLDDTLPFTGIFEGHGNTIANLYSTSSGLFLVAGSTDYPVTIQNITLDNAVVTAGGASAIFISKINGNPQNESLGGSASNDPNVITGVNITNSTGNFSGGNCGALIGRGYNNADAAVVTSCTVSGTTLNCTASSTSNIVNWGMIVGYDSGSGYSTYKDCTVTDSHIVSTTANFERAGMVAGVLAGSTIDNCDVTDCTLTSGLSTTTATADIGGIVGKSQGEAAVVKNCTVTNTDLTVAGVVNRIGLGAGHFSGGTCENVVVSGGSINLEYSASATMSSRIGGVVGVISTAEGKILNSESTDVTVNSGSLVTCVGGILGSIESSASDETHETSIIKDCATTGFTANSTYLTNSGYCQNLGGAIGRTMAKVHVTNVSADDVTFDVDSPIKAAAGFIGYVSGTYASVFTDCAVNNLMMAQQKYYTGTTDLNASKRNYHVAGFVGCADSPSKFAGCSVTTADIDVSGGTSYAGGFLGASYSSQILSTPVSAAITIKNCQVKNCDLAPQNNRNFLEFGGLAGRLSAGSKVQNCYVSTVVGSPNGNSDYLGGLIGYVTAEGNTATKTVVKNCYVEGCNFKAKDTGFSNTMIGVSSAADTAYASLFYSNTSITGTTATGGATGAGVSATNLTNGTIVDYLNTTKNTEATTNSWVQGTASPVLSADRNGTTEVSVLCYNIYWQEQDSSKPIANRQQKVINVIEQCINKGVGVMSLQEVMGEVWYDALSAYVPTTNFNWVGYGRNGYTFGQLSGGVAATADESFNLILYDTTKYTKTDEGHFWFSDTPTVKSLWEDIGWYYRVVNWVRLRDKTTGEEFIFTDLHLDETKNPAQVNNWGYTIGADQCTESRIKQANLVCSMMAAEADAYGIPVIVAGDFNSAHYTGDAYTTMLDNGYQSVRDFALTADTHGGYNAFDRMDTSTFAKGDHIFTSPLCTATSFDVITDDIDSASGYHVSDHCPIISVIQY